MRARNLSTVLREVLAHPAELSRADISKSTGLTRATVSRLVEELIAASLIEELPEPEVTRGRPATRLRPTRGQFISLGLEVNVERVAVTMMDLGGEILSRRTLRGDHADSDAPTVLRELGALGREVLGTTQRRTTYLGAALGVPGLVSGSAVANAPNLGWRELPLETIREALEGLDVGLVANEADLAAMAHAFTGPGTASGRDYFVYVSGEVGVGAGIFLADDLVRGATGWSGELGHVCVNPEGPLCSCGAKGCLEAYLGSRALLSAAGLPPDGDITALVDLFEQGNDRAVDTIRNAGAALGRALSAAINLVDVTGVILGGHVGDIGELLIPHAEAEMRVRVLDSDDRMPTITIAPDRKWDVTTGAAYAVFRDLIDNPINWTAPTR